MYALIEKRTNSGKKLYYKINKIERVVFFDDVGARIQVDSDCCVRKPVKPKDDVKYNKI